MPEVAIQLVTEVAVEPPVEIPVPAEEVKIETPKKSSPKVNKSEKRVVIAEPEEQKVIQNKKTSVNAPREQPKQKSFKQKQDIDVKGTRPTTGEESINSVIFAIRYVTVPGQDLFLCGDDSKLGKWDPSSEKVPLTWTDDHMWVTTLSVKELPLKAEYKFLIREIDGSITWETRENRIFDITKIGYSVRTSNRLKSKGFTNIEKGTVKLDFDSQEGVVTLTHKWSE